MGRISSTRLPASPAESATPGRAELEQPGWTGFQRLGWAELSSPRVGRLPFTRWAGISPARRFLGRLPSLPLTGLRRPASIDPSDRDCSLRPDRCTADPPGRHVPSRQASPGRARSPPRHVPDRHRTLAPGLHHSSTGLTSPAETIHTDIQDDADPASRVRQRLVLLTATTCQRIRTKDNTAGHRTGDPCPAWLQRAP